jgi:hypothetical protein
MPCKHQAPVRLRLTEPPKLVTFVLSELKADKNVCVWHAALLWLQWGRPCVETSYTSWHPHVHLAAKGMKQ